NNGMLKITKTSDASVYRIYRIGDITAASGYYKLNANPVHGVGALANNDPIIVSFAQSGKDGADGATGAVILDKQVYTATASSPWSKPAGAKMVHVIVIGGGGSGGSAATSGTNRPGGGGGGGGSIVEEW